MKKVNKKLSLSKMTVAQLRLNAQQMQLVNGGDATKPTNPIILTANSIVDDPPCGAPPTVPTAA